MRRRPIGLLVVAFVLIASVGPAIAAPVEAPPVHPFDFPDPSLVPVDGGWRAFSTNVRWTDVPILSSEDPSGLPVGWSPAPEANGYPDDAIMDLPEWAIDELGRTWAPEVVFLGGRWVLYFTTGHAASGLQCIGVAVSPSVDGPYEPVGDAPFVCPIRRGGAIDASVFSDRQGAPWLVWKDDGNCCGRAVTIRSRPLTGDGLGFGGPAHELLRADRRAEAGIVEGPAMLRRGNRYYLFFGAERWESEASWIGYARCAGPTGPCVKARPARWLSSGATGLGPAGPAVATDATGSRWFAHHAWDPTRGTGYDGAEPGVRQLYVHRLSFVDGAPVLNPL